MKTLKLLNIFALIMVLTAGLNMPLAFAGDREPGTMPLQGFGTLRVVLAAGMIDCLAPDGTVVAPFPAELDALARYTGLGRTVGVIMADSCDFNPANGTLEVAGVAFQTAASGDEIFAPYIGVFQPDFSFSLDVEVVGGTGRFANTCGAAEADGMLDPVTGVGESWLDGWISTVGSSAKNDLCD